jgi:branched-chain amino acid transport system permease protein
MEAFLQYTLSGVTVGAFYALVALGYTIVYGIVRLINFAHGDLVMVGSFVAWMFVTATFSAGLPRWAMLILVFVIPMLAVGVMNLLILRLAYQPLLQRSILAVLIVAIGVSIAVEQGAMLVFGAGYKALPSLLPPGAFVVANTPLSYVQIALVAISLVLMLILYLFTMRTTLGTAMRALAIDHDAARLMGVDVEQVVGIAFLAGGVLAGASGVMIGLYYGQINYTLGFVLGLRAFTAAVLGGIGNIPGAMVGGLCIGLLQAYCAGYFSSRWQDVVLFGVLIALLVVKPNGILGERVAERM